MTRTTASAVGTGTIIATAATIGLATFFSYAGALDNGFVVWDTRAYVVDNPYVHSLSAENLRWMFTTAKVGLWHPLTWLSHAADVSMHGLDPAGHHLTSVLLHCANSIGVFLLFLVLATPAGRPDPRALLGSALAALLFGLHPQHVESVAWVAERKDVLCLLFSLATLIGYACWTRARSPGRRRLLYLATALSLAMALMAKPMAVTLPAVLLLLDLHPLGRLRVSASLRLEGGGRELWLRVREKLPFVALVLPVMAILVPTQQASGALVPLSSYGLGDRALTILSALTLYLWKLAAPVDLSPFYPYAPIRAFRGAYGALIPLSLVVAISAIVVAAWRRGHRSGLTAWLFFLVTIAPVIGIVQIGTQGAADRYTYLPTLPFFGLAGAGGVALAGIRTGRRRRCGAGGKAARTLR